MPSKENPFANPDAFCFKKSNPKQVMRATPAIIRDSKGKLIACDEKGNALDAPKKGSKAPAKAEKEAPGETGDDDAGKDAKSDRKALEAECKKLGISFRKTVKDETLRKKIEAAKAS